MTVTAASFRSHFPEFADVTAYPDSGVNYWLNLAGLLLNASRWTTILDTGTELFIAHNLAIEAKAQREAANGGIPGQSSGPINNKSVDKVSIGYDTQAGLEPDAGHWNLTVYGTRFIRLAKMMGAGPIQIGIGCASPLSSGGAWIGPYPYPGWFSS